MERRDFLKIVGLTTAGMTTSCTDGYHWMGFEQKEFKSYIEDDGKIPGKPEYYATACTECSANCGMTVKVHYGNAVKVDGNPDHPVNQGKLCLRGQASLVRMYHPERLRNPKIKDGDNWKDISWEDAYKRILTELKKAAQDEKRKSAYLAGRTNGTLARLISEFCEQMGVERLKEFEHYSHAALRQANEEVFGLPYVPFYNIEESDLFVSLGADVLETFVSPTSHARQFAKAKQNKKWKWFHLEPHMTINGTSANYRMIVKAKSEIYLLRYLFHALQGSFQQKVPASIAAKVAKISLEDTAAKTGLAKEKIEKLTKALKEAKKPLLLSGGVSVSHESGLEVAMLTAVLQWGMGLIGKTVDFNKGQEYSNVGNLNDIEQLAQSLSKDEVGVLFLSRNNFLPHMPSSFQFDENISKATFRVGLGQFITEETLSKCDLVLPLSHTIESIDDTLSRRGVMTLVQPVIKTLHNTRQEGDILLQILRSNGAKTPPSYENYLYDEWSSWQGVGNVIQQDKLQKFLSKGFFVKKVAPVKVELKEESTQKFFNSANMDAKSSEKMVLVVTPSLRLFDGRSKHLRLTEEIPDALSTVTYGQWVSMSDSYGKKNGFADRDEVEITGANDFSISLPVKLQPGLAEDVVVVQMPVNLSSSLSADKRCGQMASLITEVSVKKTGRSVALPILSGSMRQNKRHIIPGGHEHHHNPTSPISFYFDPKERYKESGYRWAMAINLDACTGCGTCVASCYMENNVPVVGKEEHLKGREMSWLRLEPYVKHQHGEEEQEEIEFIPVLCQQCGQAPCEAVCPVNAANHSNEGLNVQTYDRCVGTRYCANNCPFKVRRFNWFSAEWPEPLDKMANPTVSRRTKGIMEKCSFCVQRIRYAKDKAKDEDRLVRDGEFTSACAQACPTDAITFGNLMDEKSQVHQMASGKTGMNVHQILDEIGVMPAVYYLHSEEDKHGHGHDDKHDKGHGNEGEANGH
jgi:molybdopterin-containing oxidoreductase family iron-sulfur binding subunit